MCSRPLEGQLRLEQRQVRVGRPHAQRQLREDRLPPGRGGPEGRRVHGADDRGEPFQAGGEVRQGARLAQEQVRDREVLLPGDVPDAFGPERPRQIHVHADPVQFAGHAAAAVLHRLQAGQHAFQAPASRLVRDMRDERTRVMAGKRHRRVVWTARQPTTPVLRPSSVRVSAWRRRRRTHEVRPRRRTQPFLPCGERFGTAGAAEFLWHPAVELPAWHSTRAS